MEIDDHLLVGCDRTGRMVSLDPVSAVIASAMDGRTTTDELGQDLSDATGMEADVATKVVDLLVDALARDGFIDGVEPSDGIPRGAGAVIPTDSCLATRMGLDRSTVLIADCNQPFRFGSTDPELVAATAAMLTEHGIRVLDDTDDGQPIVFLRSSTGRVERLQQMFGSLGRRWFARRDHAAATSAFRRTVLARCQPAGASWLEGVSLRNAHGIVLVQPGLEDVVMGDLRGPLEAVGVTQVPSARLRLESDGQVVVPSDPGAGHSAERCRIVGAVLPERCSRPEQVRQLSHLLVHWDRASLQSLATATSDIPSTAASGIGGDWSLVARATADLGAR